MKALQYVWSSFNIDVVFDDFNQTHSKTLRSVMESKDYRQIVTKPTFVSADSLLDHVYVKTTSIQINNSSVVSVYYFDHDAVVTSLQYVK